MDSAGTCVLETSGGQQEAYNWQPELEPAMGQIKFSLIVLVCPGNRIVVVFSCLMCFEPPKLVGQY